MRDWLNARLAALRSRSGAAEVERLPHATLAPFHVADLYHSGLVEEARQQARVRLAADPADAQALVVEALAAVDAGEHRPAAQKLKAHLDQHPDDSQAWIAIARAHAAGRRYPAAREALAQALRLDPGSGPAQVEMALVDLAQQHPHEALARLAQATGTGPRLAEAFFELAEIAREARQPQAIQQYRRALAADSKHAKAHANLGAMLKDQGQAQEALRHLEEALSLAPELAEAAFNLAMLLVQQRDWSGAAKWLRHYVARYPKDADGHYWLANAVMGLGNAREAREEYQAAVRLETTHVQARWGLVMAQWPPIADSDAEQVAAVSGFSGELAKLKTWFATRRGNEGWRAVGAQQPFYAAYVSRNHRDALGSYGSLCASLMADWARKVGVPAPSPAGQGKLRVGIVSAHIHSHSVWHAVVRGWLEHLDPARFELRVFHTGPARDAETEWASRRAAKLHHKVGDWTAWAKLISDERCDTLVYPEIGMDATTVRLSALRLARVQLASWGHPITTGLPTIDGYISAEGFEPADAALHYTEPLITLPRLGCAYRPYDTQPQPADLSEWGIGASDGLLLCAGVAFKYAPRDDALWVDIAGRCGGAKLVFFRAAADETASHLERRLRAAFSAAQLDFDKHVRFIPWQSQAVFFGLLQRAHAYLDSVGFSGFNTAMQAVQCGTPIVAWEGEFMRGRFAGAILRQLDLGEWIASSHEAFAQAAERLCRDPALRRQVRDQLAARRGALYDDKPAIDALAGHLLRLAGR
jgi:protein O-GlcNAc transferase